MASITPPAGNQAATVAYYHRDMMGSTVAVSQAGQAGASPVTYNDFGLPGSGVPLPYGFAGYRYDAETGVCHLQTRYYSPLVGRFLQTDPLGVTGSSNL